jgi:hypothetical protein
MLAFRVSDIVTSAEALCPLSLGASRPCVPIPQGWREAWKESV